MKWIEQTEDLRSLSRKELTQYILDLQAYFQALLKSGLTVDQILDQEDPFEIIEPVLQREEYPVFVLTIINNIKSDVVINTLLESVEKGLAALPGTTIEPRIR